MIIQERKKFMPLTSRISFVFIILVISFFCNEAFSNTQDEKVFYFDKNQKLKMRFIKIPSGKTQMGDIKGQKDEKPRVTVNIPEFYMQDSEVTKGLFQWYVQRSGVEIEPGCQIYKNQWVYDKHASWKKPGYKQEANHPVVCVNWGKVIDFTKWLSEKLPGNFRLPTESEWEHAARAGSIHRYYWGEDPKGLCTHANASDRQTLKRFPTFKSNDCDDGYPETAPVKQFKPNPYGLYDIYGNVWEWVQDCWNPHYHEIPLDGSALDSGDCNRRGFRGGAWGDNPHFARSGLRNRTNEDLGKDDVGFRLVWVP